MREIMIHRSALYCAKVFAFPPSLPSSPNPLPLTIRTLDLRAFTQLIVKMYRAGCIIVTQPTGMHARLYYYPTSDTVT